MWAADPAIENLSRRLRASATRLRKHCRINPLFDGGNIKLRHDGHRCQRNVANRAAASAISYRSFGIVPMVRTTPYGYGDRCDRGALFRSPVRQFAIAMKGEVMKASALSVAVVSALLIAACGDRQNTSQTTTPTGSSMSKSMPSSSSPGSPSGSSSSMASSGQSSPSSSAAPSSPPSSDQSSASQDKDKDKADKSKS